MVGLAHWQDVRERKRRKVLSGLLTLAWMDLLMQACARTPLTGRQDEHQIGAMGHCSSVTTAVALMVEPAARKGRSRAGWVVPSLKLLS
jgi:hypothetical protein